MYPYNMAHGGMDDCVDRQSGEARMLVKDLRQLRATNLRLRAECRRLCEELRVAALVVHGNLSTESPVCFETAAVKFL